jgi:WD40 repeat protein
MERGLSLHQLGGDVCVWDTDTGALISGPSKWYADSIPAVVFTPNSTYYCAVSPDGKWIVSRMDGDIMDGDNTPVHVWNLKTGKLAVGTNTHSSFVQSITFSPDSKHIVTASYDKTIQVHCLDV